MSSLFLHRRSFTVVPSARSEPQRYGDTDNNGKLVALLQVKPSDYNIHVWPTTTYDTQASIFCLKIAFTFVLSRNEHRIFPYNLLVFVTNTELVYFAVRTESLYVIKVYFRLTVLITSGSNVGL
jgi:hypothetical protein